MQNRPPPDYKDIEQKAWRENAQSVVKELQQDERNLLNKIATYVEKFGYSESEVREKIQNDEMFAAHFAIDPKRQRLHEKIADDWLNKTDGIKSFKKLSPSGENSWHVTSDGKIQQGERSEPGKLLDFRWIAGGITYFASHKYTEESGGAQGSHFEQMYNLLKKFQKCRETNHVLIVIVDGSYYTEKRMQELRQIINDHDPRSFAVHIEEVPDIINRLHNE